MRKRIALILLIVSCCIICTGSAATYRDAPETDVPDFKQADVRWKDVIYSNHEDGSQTIGEGGCGLCAVANVVSALCGEIVTPVKMAELSMANGYCSDRGGTYLSFHSAIANWYPLRVVKTSNIEDALKCLNRGGLVIAIFSSGPWNQNPDFLHCTTIYACTDGEVWMHDSGWSDPLLSSIMGHGSVEKISKAADWYYCYTKKE